MFKNIIMPSRSLTKFLNIYLIIFFILVNLFIITTTKKEFLDNYNISGIYDALMNKKTFLLVIFNIMFLMQIISFAYTLK
jgi:hypothetical protein